MILLLIFIIILYTTGQKMYSLLGFFFFLTDGFQLLPEEWFWIGDNEIKSQDYALAFLLVGLSVSILCGKRMKFSIYPVSLKVFSAFLLLTIFLSMFYYHIPVVEIIRSSRLFLLFLSPLLFLDLTSDEIGKLKKYLFAITIFITVIYTLQPITGFQILNGYGGMGKMDIAGFHIKRFYNLPFFLYYFLFYVIFSCSNSKSLRFASILLFSFAIILSMHRSLIIGCIMTIILVIMTQESSVNTKTKSLILVALIITPFASIILERIQKGQTMTEITQILKGDISDLDYEDELDGKTLLFRLAHFCERASFVSEKPLSFMFGSGWMSESSPYTQSNFDFIVGLPDKKTDEPVQIDTSDITWSLTIIRLGYLGTLIYIWFIVSIMLYFYKKREIQTAKVPLSNLVLFVITSFTSILLFSPIMLVLVLVDYFSLKGAYECDKKELCLSQS